jgi:hypothetical protein
MKKILPFLHLLIFIPFLTSGATIMNDHLLVDVDENSGRFYCAAVKGKRNDLLFYDTPPSSYTVVYIDSDAVIFGSERGTFLKRALTVGRSIITLWENELVAVEQNLRFISRTESGVEDGVLIEYRVENKTSTKLEVGLRILFDTCLGESGKCHFQLPGGGELCTETELHKSDLPAVWFSRDNSSNCLMGTLRTEAMSTPDRVVFANYRALRENLFRYTVKKRRSFDYPPFSLNDSAVALYFDAQELGTGESRTYRTILSLCGDGGFSLEEKKPVKEALPQGKVGVQTPPEYQKQSGLSETELAAVRAVSTELEKLLGSLKELDGILERLNSILVTEKKELTSEEAARLRNQLDELTSPAK